MSCIVMGSDGLWDNLSFDTVMNDIASTKWFQTRQVSVQDLDQTVEGLVKKAYHTRIKADDITCCIVPWTTNQPSDNNSRTNVASMEGGCYK